MADDAVLGALAEKVREQYPALSADQVSRVAAFYAAALGGDVDAMSQAFGAMPRIMQGRILAHMRELEASLHSAIETLAPVHDSGGLRRMFGARS